MINEVRNHKLDKSLGRIDKKGEFIYNLHNHDVDLQSNHIYLMGVDTFSFGTGNEMISEPGIEYVIANRFIRNFNLCMRANPNQPIVIHMKTCGGDYTEGMAIYDTIRSCPFPVTILSYTHARSMSSIIFQAASKRVMMPNSYFMFHEGELTLSGTSKQVRTAAKFNLIADDTMLSIYANNMVKQGKFKGVELPKIKKWLQSEMDKKEDVFLMPHETIELGLADEIFDYDWESLTQYTEEQLKR
jgi:ATP-dependent Clp protease protease subunit